MSEKRRFPESFYNMTTVVSVVLALIFFSLIVFLFLIDLFAHQGSPYMGIIALIILPGFLVLCLLIAIVGILRARWRIKKGTGQGPLHFALDLHNKKHRSAFILVTISGVLFIMASSFGSYFAYDYTESVSFCGRVCHKVMAPEYETYKLSPHARVACVQCHIGPGATWFVRSKLSGSYQVYSAIFNKYSKPIATPVHDLRPAQETCEQCHWPKMFYSQKLQTGAYFLASDPANPRTDITLAVKIGGGNPGTQPSEGIHWHMYLNNEITYISTDKQRLQIPWVQSKGADGTITVYQSTETPLTNEQVAKGTKRKIDCIDCHNRPSHIFRPPDQCVNKAMGHGEISPELPGIKQAALDALNAEYKTTNQAMAQIAKSINDNYQANYPDVLSTKGPLLQAAIEAVKKIYRENFFPEMKANWSAHPNNQGHLYSPGCFRCHDGKHVSPAGKVITNNCNTCHTILAQQVQGQKQRVSIKGLEFEHPMDIGDAWKTTNCSESGCHGL
jgi:hypothetical protein